MPNVVKWGKVPEKKPAWWENTLIECDKCESRFLLDEADLKPGGGWRYDDMSRYCTGHCPVCAAPVSIDVGKLTRGEPAVNQNELAQMYEGHRYQGDAGDDTA